MANVAIQWMIPCSLFSQTVFFGELLLPLLPAILHLQSATSDPEAANRAKFLAITWAWGGWNLPVDGGEGGELLIAKLLKMLRKMSKDANWHVRKAVTSFLATVIPRHAFVLSKASSDQLEKDPLPALKTAKATIVNLLSDSQVEVREGAAKALQAMLSSLPGSGGVAGGMKMSKMTNKMYKKLYKMSRTVIPQFSAAKDEKMKEQRGIAINTRHGGLLGLSAFILSQPYAVPEWLPATLIGLAPHTRDAIPIGTTAKKLFQEFTRTHQVVYTSSFIRGERGRDTANQSYVDQTKHFPCVRYRVCVLFCVRTNEIARPMKAAPQNKPKKGKTSASPYLVNYAGRVALIRGEVYGGSTGHIA
mmetsp:Transcript_33872/g.57433  ORF Transcript_33872/g.57433 Transcript_33872/m.57433 type:complete len:361 (-) Transcript_33872:432-1514(-)